MCTLLFKDTYDTVVHTHTVVHIHVPPLVLKAWAPK